MFDLILVPFAWLFRTLYFIFENYGVAILLFCLLTKVVLFPLSLKGKKSMIKMNGLTAQQQELQKKYGNDKAKLNIELQKLFEREKVSPTSGCLWSMLPLPILIGLYSILRRPLTYLMDLTTDEINTISNFITGEILDSSSVTGEIVLAEQLFGKFDEVTAAIPEVADKLFALDFSFLGLNLSQTPNYNIFAFSEYSWATIGLFLIPVLSAALSFLSMKVTNKTNAMSNQVEQSAQMKSNMMMMSVMMPVMSLWIGFTLPAGLGVYWVGNSVFTMLQELLAGKMLKKDYEEAARRAEQRKLEEKQEEKERKARISEQRAQAIAEGKKKPKNPDRKKIDPSVTAASRVGIRAYARGRAYDPNRYGGVTTYGGAVQEETVVEGEEMLSLPVDEVETTAVVAEADMTQEVEVNESASEEKN